MPRLRTLGPRVATLDTRTARPPPKTADPELLAPQWRALVADLKRERGDRCEDCGRTGTRIFGDHIVERQDGGAVLDRANIRLRCGSCHGLKTAAERRKRMEARL